MNYFQELQLPLPILKALQKLNFTEPTQIQSKAIPVILEKKDILGFAQTGSGKTAAYCLPVLTNLLQSQQSQALILAPTRELAIQISHFWKLLTHFTPKERAVLVTGGASSERQIKELKLNPSLIIATPGRLVDHIRTKSVSLGRIQTLVLDEADRMLDMGFAPQIQEILKHLPTTRQTLFFSATWNSSLDQMSQKILQNPSKIHVGETSQAAPEIHQKVINTSSKQKNDLLLERVNHYKGSILVFTRTQIKTDRVAEFLADYGVSVSSIHGGRTQGQRNSAIRDFRAGNIRVLVATDIASRGIDIPEIQAVINYDLPQLPEDYIHRIGRTGRAGAKGTAISLVSPEEKILWNQIIKLLKKSGSEIPEDHSKKIEVSKKDPTQKNQKHKRPQQGLKTGHSSLKRNKPKRRS